MSIEARIARAAHDGLCRCKTPDLSWCESTFGADDGDGCSAYASIAAAVPEPLRLKAGGDP